MANGSFTLTRTGNTSQYITFTCNWTATSNGTAANSSSVNVKIIASKSSASSSNTWGDYNASAIVNNSTQSVGNTSFTLTPGGSITLLNKTYTVPHNSDGTKSTTISASVGGTVMWGNGSKSITLDKIPRQATITSAPDFTDEENPTIKYSNPAGNSVTSLDACISLTGATDDIQYRSINKTGSSYTFNLTEQERNILRQATPNSNNLKVKFYVRTVISGSTLYSNVEKTMTIVNGAPIFNDFTYKDINNNVVAITGSDQTIVKGLSNLQITIPVEEKMEALKYATENKYTAIVDTLNGTSNYSETEDVIINLGTPTGYGAKTLTVNAYDSRNNFKPITKTINIYDYFIPTINLEAERQNNFENTTIIKVDGTFSTLNINNEDKNIVNFVKYRYREIGSDTWTNYQNATFTASNNGRYICNDIAINLDNTKQFEIEILVEDNFTSVTKTINVDVGVPLFLISTDGNAYVGNDRVLTEADVESGSNENGNWIKYPDGTMICWRRKTFTGIVFNSAWGSVYETVSQSFGATPQTFISTPAIFTSVDNASYAGVEGIHNASTNSFGEAQLFRPVSGTATVALNILAIGKWK